jgi:hypothetical protein
MGSSERKRRRRSRLVAPEPLDELLERAGENRFAKKQLPIPLAHWRAAVGPKIADRARPTGLERGVLIVTVVTSVWANELSMLAPQLIAKLAERGFAEVKSLRFRVGPLDRIEGIQQKKDYRRIPPPVPLAPELERSLAKIDDEDLRDTIERAARANLAWQSAPASRATQPPKATTAVPPSVRVPRDVGRGSVRPDRNAEDSDEASPRSSGGGSDRRR